MSLCRVFSCVVGVYPIINNINLYQSFNISLLSSCDNTFTCLSALTFSKVKTSEPIVLELINRINSNNTRDDSTHGHHQLVNTEIRLIIFFAAKDGEVLYSQQKQGWELTVAQIMSSLLQNSDLN